MMGPMTQPAAAPRSLRVLAGFTSLALALVVVATWAPPLLETLSTKLPPEPIETGGTLALLWAIFGTLLFYLLLATWFATPSYQRRGIVSAGFGLVLYTVWPTVDGAVAGWRSHPWVQLVPESLGLAPYSWLVANLGIAAITTILLLVGAALLLTRPPLGD